MEVWEMTDWQFTCVGGRGRKELAQSVSVQNYPGVNIRRHRFTQGRS